MENIVKAGWLHRQSTLLGIWKIKWFVLNKEGEFMYYNSSDHEEPEERKLLYAVCSGIYTGERECHYSPPEGCSPACLLMLKIKSKNGDHDEKWKLCAESTGDLYAWKIVLEEARANNPFLNQNQQRYQQIIHSGGAGNVHVTGPQYGNIVYASAPPPQVITIEDDPVERNWNRRYDRYRRLTAPDPYPGAVLSRRW